MAPAFLPSTSIKLPSLNYTVNTAMDKLPLKLQQCVEALCGEGCKAVYRHIEQLESGGSLPQTEFLSYEEQQEVLTELKSIMAVYGSNCRL